MRFNYQKICSNLFQNLPDRTQDILVRRFGLKTGKKETLASIGKVYGVTRERIRQIETDGLLKLKPELKKNQKVFQYFTDALDDFGRLKKEDILLSHLGDEQFNPHIFFLLKLSDQFDRRSEDEDFFSLWTIDHSSLDHARIIIDDFHSQLIKRNQPLGLGGYSPPLSLRPKALTSYLEVSKLIDQGPGGRFGLRDWPEISPRGVKDKAYLVLKGAEKPLHFTEIAKMISPHTLVQTVHNELIRDPRFILVGRGIYALSDWGYKPGTVKDVIREVLKKAERPLSKEQILKEVLKRRLVKENTVLLNLSNKEDFLRNSQGKYILRNNNA